MFKNCVFLQANDPLAIFGKGFYFSQRADKAHYYTHGGGKLLVAIVAMGSCTTAITPDEARTAPPMPTVTATQEENGSESVQQVDSAATALHSMLVPGRPRYRLDMPQSIVNHHLLLGRASVVLSVLLVYLNEGESRCRVLLMCEYADRVRGWPKQQGAWCASKHSHRGYCKTFWILNALQCLRDFEM